MSSPAPSENRVTIFLKISSGAFVAAAGLSALYGWHTGKTIFAGGFADLPQVHYFAAVLLALSGAAIATSVFRNNLIPMVLPVILVFAAVFEAFDEFIGVPVDFASALGFEGVNLHQIHSTAIGTVTFLFIGLALIVQKQARKHGPIISGSLGAFAFSCGLASMVGLWAGYAELLKWGTLTEISLPGAIAFFVAGAVLIFSSRTHKNSSKMNWTHYIPVTILVTGLTVSFCVRQYMRVQDVASINGTVAFELHNLKSKVETEVTRRLIANERMADRWAEHGGISQRLWEKDAKRYYEDFGGYQSLEYVDNTYHVRLIVPFEANKSALGLDLANDATSLKALELAKVKRTTILSSPVQLVQGGTGVRSFSPIYRDDEFMGFIQAVFRTEDFFGKIVPADVRKGYSIAIADEQTVLYESDRSLFETKSELNQSSTLDLGGNSYSIDIRPNHATLQGMSAKNADIALLLGTLISLLLAGSVLLAQRARRHSSFTNRTNKLLKSEIEGRKRIETILRETSTFRKAILNGANCMIISTDCDGMITSFNRTAEYLLGYTADDLIGLYSLDHFHVEDEIKAYTSELAKRYGYQIEPGFETLVVRARDRIADEREWSYKCKNGSRFPVALSVTAIEDEYNQITGYLAIGRDNSQLYNTSQRLIESEERFKAVVNNTPALVYIKDHKGRFIFSNNKFENLLRLEPGDLIGKTVYDIADKATADGVWEIEERVLRTDVPEESAELVRLGDKPLAHYLFVRFTIPSITQEKCLGVIAIDLSPQLEVEEELRAANRAAVESSRMKSEFLANMSHEIRTPMNGVLGMLEVLLDTSLNASQREYAEVIQVSAKSLLTILDDILDFSKLEAGKLSFETIEFDLRSTLENTIVLFAESAESKGIEITSLIESDVPTALLGDPGRLRQILTNLIGNAVKFTDHGLVEIRVSGNHDKDAKATLRFKIADTGIGISKEAQEYLFEAFVQADGSMARKYGGTGLGLSISKQLVELMNGEISVDSEPGNGSAFTFTADFDIQDNADRPTPPVDFCGAKALITDDLEINRRSISSQLKSLGFETVEASSGKESIEILQSHASRGEHFDVVILDHEMPGLSGLETFEIIERNLDLNDTKIVMMTAFSRRGNALEEPLPGVSAYLNKPIRQTELYECITIQMTGVTLSGYDRSETEWLGGLIAQSTLSETHATACPPILIATGDLRNQGVLSMQLELLGYRSDLVSDGNEALAAVNRRSYTLILLEIESPGLDGITTANRIRKHLHEDDVPIIGITTNPPKDSKKAAPGVGLDDLVSLPMSEELLGEMISTHLTRKSGNKAPESVEHSPAAGPAKDDSADQSVEDFVQRLIEDIGPEMAAMNFSLFAEDGDRHIIEIKSCAEESDFDRLADLSGSLMLVCDALGAAAMQECCWDINQSAAAGDADGVAAAVRRLETAFGSVIRQIEQLSFEPSIG